MLEKAELTLIKMLSKTKKVITTPPPVLCSIASYRLFYTIERMLEYFHYYLCRQLKGGGMEINKIGMKKRRCSALLMVDHLFTVCTPWARSNGTGEGTENVRIVGKYS